jgi:hypothetical protein
MFFMGLLVAVGIAFSQIDLESLRGNILHALRDATNMQVEIDGKMSWHFSLRPEIELNDVRIPNADWAKNKNLFSAKKIDVRLDLLSMFGSHPVIRHIKIHDAKIAIEKNNKDENSIVFIKSQTPEDVPDTEKNIIARYPVEQLPFGGMDIDKLSVNLYGEKYELSSFGISNYMRHSNREFSGWVKPYDTNFPFVIQFSEYNTERKIYPVRIAFATGGEALIVDTALEGTSKLPIDFVVSGEIPNLKKLGEWFKQDIADVPKMKINVAFNIGRKKISFRKSSIESNGSSINFSGTYDWSKTTPVARFNVSSDMINLYKSFPDWYGVGTEWIHPNRELNIFKDMPLFGEYLYNVDGEININFKHFIVYRHLDLSDMDVKLKIKNQTVRVDANVGIADGRVNAVIDSYIHENGVYDATMAAVGHNVYVGKIIDQVDVKDILSGLPMDIDLYVKAHGKNMSEIMQTITGPVLVVSTDRGFAHADLVAYMYGGDFLTTLRNSVEDMFTGNKRDMIQIDGAVVNVILRNGLIQTQNGVAVETKVINMRLAGDLDLGKETIQLSLATVPVGGLKLSLSGNLVNALQISGNLAEPDFKISGAAVAGKVGSAVGIGLLLSPLTGGLSIAGGLLAGVLAGDLLEGWLADEHPYKTAQKSGAPYKRADPDWLRRPVKELSNSLSKTKEK